MTLDHLRIFVEVAERGHVMRAAEALSMSQSAASIAIATLEAYDHIKLFDWGPSPLFNQCDAFDGSGVSIGVRAPLPDADIASTAFRDGQL